MVARQYDVNANQVFTWRKLYGGACAAGSAAVCAGGRDAGAACGTLAFAPAGAPSRYHRD